MFTVSELMFHSIFRPALFHKNIGTEGNANREGDLNNIYAAGKSPSAKPAPLPTYLPKHQPHYILRRLPEP